LSIARKSVQEPWFRLKLRDDVVRKMSREEYERSESYIRLCARTIRESMVLDGEALSDLCVYGASPAIMAFPDVKKVDLKEFYNEAI
jgi:hypothetical protein